MYGRLFSALFSGTGYLLVLPVCALLLFIAIFALVVAKVMRKGPDEFATVAALPLAEEQSHE